MAHAGTGELAIAIGGVLFAARALANVSESYRGAGRVIAWRKSNHCSGRAGETRLPATFVPSAGAIYVSGRPLLDACGTQVFAAGRSIFSATSTSRSGGGEKLLLERRARGSGKSTLAALLLGLRTPERDRLLLAGYGSHRAWWRVAGACRRRPGFTRITF